MYIYAKSPFNKIKHSAQGRGGPRFVLLSGIIIMRETETQAERKRERDKMSLIVDTMFLLQRKKVGWRSDHNHVVMPYDLIWQKHPAGSHTE